MAHGSQQGSLCPRQDSCKRTHLRGERSSLPWVCRAVSNICKESNGKEWRSQTCLASSTSAALKIHIWKEKHTHPAIYGLGLGCTESNLAASRWPQYINPNLAFPYIGQQPTWRRLIALPPGFDLEYMYDYKTSYDNLGLLLLGRSFWIHTFQEDGEMPPHWLGPPGVVCSTGIIMGCFLIMTLI